MPGQIQQSLGFLTAYLKDENKRLDQEIKEKQLNTLLIKAGDKFQNVSSTEDARDMYYELMSMAGTLDVGKEATPFLNQMLSTSVAFIKEDEAKAHQQSYISALTRQGYDVANMNSEDATRIVSTSLASLQELEQTNVAGQVSYGIYKKGPHGLTYQNTISKDERTDEMKLRQQKELIRTKEAYSPSNRLDIRPSTYTFTPKGSNVETPVDWSEDIGYFYRNENGQRVKATSETGTFDQKTSSTVKISGDRNVLESQTSTSEDKYKGDARSLAIALKGSGIIDDSKLFDPVTRQYIGGNETLLYTAKNSIKQQLDVNTKLTPTQKQEAYDLLNTFTSEYDTYTEYKKALGELKNDVSKGPKNTPIDDATIMNEIRDILKDPTHPNYKDLAGMIDGVMPTTLISPWGKWNNSQYGSSPAKKDKIFQLYKKNRTVKQ